MAPLVATSAAALLGAAVTRRDAPAEADEVMYGVDVPYKEAAYDPVAADAFFRKRPVATVKRALQLTRLSGGFILSTVVDRLLKRQDDLVFNETYSAVQYLYNMRMASAICLDVRLKK